MGEPKWQVSTILGMLQNEKYKGEALLQKTFTADYFTKRMVKNEGQIEQIRVKESHPPIIDSEAWEATQLEIKRQKEYLKKFGLRAIGRYTDEQPFSCKVICGNCGDIFYRRTWTRSNGKHFIWQCSNRYKVKGIIEQKDDFLERWSKQEKDGNPLEKLKARQFRTIVEKGVLLNKVDNNLVNLVLERIEVYELGLLKFYFIDETEIEIDIN